MTRLLVFIFQALSVSVYAAETEVMWVKFQVNRTYNDAAVSCTGLSAKGQLLFSAEVENGVVKKAKLHNFPMVFPYKAIYRALPLSQDEVKSVRLFQDSRGFRWVAALTLSESTLRWAIYESALRYAHCATPQTIATVTPNGVTLEFETEGLEEGIWVSESNKVLFSGTRKDGLSFSGSLQLTQKEYLDGL